MPSLYISVYQMVQSQVPVSQTGSLKQHVTNTYVSLSVEPARLNTKLSAGRQT